MFRFSIQQYSDKKIGFIKAIRALGKALGRDLGLKEAKALADLERPLVIEAQSAMKPLIESYLDEIHGIDLLYVRLDDGLTHTDVDHVARLFEQDDDYDWQRRDRVLGTLRDAANSVASPDLVQRPYDPYDV